MAKRMILFLVVALVAIVVGTYAYSRYRTDRRLNGGEVFSDDSGKVGNDDGVAPVTISSRPDTTVVTGEQPQRSAVTPTPAPATAAATTDSLPLNPPNRAVFAGTGRFQVYRQGDLTWRLNTDTGSACVLFATEEEWRRPIVYRDACIEK